MTAFLVDRLTPGRCRNKLLSSPRSPSVFELTAHFAARDVGLAAMSAAMRVACAVSYMSLPSSPRIQERNLGVSSTHTYMATPTMERLQAKAA